MLGTICKDVHLFCCKSQRILCVGSSSQIVWLNTSCNWPSRHRHPAPIWGCSKCVRQDRCRSSPSIWIFWPLVVQDRHTAMYSKWAFTHSQGRMDSCLRFCWRARIYTSVYLWLSFPSCCLVPLHMSGCVHSNLTLCLGLFIISALGSWMKMMRRIVAGSICLLFGFLSLSGVVALISSHSYMPSWSVSAASGIINL